MDARDRYANMEVSYLLPDGPVNVAGIARVTGGADHTVRMWDVATRRQTGEQECEQDDEEAADQSH